MSLSACTGVLVRGFSAQEVRLAPLTSAQAPDRLDIGTRFTGPSVLPDQPGALGRSLIGLGELAG